MTDQRGIQMGLLELCLLSMLSPQEPAAAIAPQTPVAVTDPATWLPAEALAAVIWQASDGNAELAGLWQQVRSLDARGLLRHAEGEFLRGLGRAGFEAGDLADLQRGGIAVALLGFTTGNQPRFVAVAHAPQRAERMQAILERLATANGAQQATVAGRPCLQFSLDGLDCYGGCFGQHFVLATDAPTMAEVLAKTQQETSSSLAAAPDYATARTATDCGGSTQLVVFARPKQLFAIAGSLAPPEMRQAIDRVGDALQLPGMDRAMLRLGASGRQLRCGASFPLPSDQGLLAAMLGDAARLQPQLAEAVPPSAREFSFSTLDLGATVTAALLLAAELQPAVGQAVDAKIEQIAAASGTNLRTDLIGGFAGQIVAVRFENGYGVSLSLRDGARFGRSLAALVKASGAPLQAATIAGVAVRRVDPEAGTAPFCFGTVGNWLCIADTDANFAELVQQHASPAADPDAAAALQQAPAGTMMLQASRGSADRTTVVRTAGQIVVQSRVDLASFVGEVAAGSPTTGATPQPAGTSPPPCASAAEVAALRKAEREPQTTELAQLETLVSSTNPAVAARGTWLLAAQKGPEAVALLERLATSSPDAEVRLQAIHGLFRARSVSSVGPAIEALDDEDQRVRTVAAQILGKLRRPVGRAALVALLNRAAPAKAGPCTDLQAAILALCDMEAKDQLLPAATAIQTSGAPGTSQALTFYFQTLSPKLPHEDEVTLLLAVLDHREPMLRRYAIGRLAELADAASVTALESRLVTEGDELRPLVEIALQRVRQQSHLTATADQTMEGSLLARVQQRWTNLSLMKKATLLGLLAACIAMFVVVTIALARRRTSRAAAAAAAATCALVEPSAEFVEQSAEEAQQLAEAADSLIDGSVDDTPQHEETIDDAAAIDGAETEADTGTELPLAEDEVVLHDDAERQR